MVRIGGRLSDGSDTFEPVGDARYDESLCPCGGYAYVDSEGEGYCWGEGYETGCRDGVLLLWVSLIFGCDAIADEGN